MKVGNIYKHINNKDVCFHLTDIIDNVMSRKVNEDDTLCVGYWINIVEPNKAYYIIKDQICITKEELSNWKLINIEDGVVLNNEVK